MNLRVIITGGTFDKRYDAIRGQLTFEDTHLPDIIKQVRSSLTIELELNQLVDSLDMQDENRQRVLDACRHAREELIVITHGTDTMAETAGVLGRAVDSGETGLSGKRIVLTGAMVPYTFGSSDGLFNLGSALAFAQTMPEGVYVAMNGRCFDWNNVRKNRETGRFVESTAS